MKKFINKKKIDVGIVGTGYGNYVILEALNKLKYINKIVICGRNKSKLIELQNKKKIHFYYSSINNFLKQKFTLICLATVPLIQYKILQRIKKDQYKYLFLEKPLANNLLNSKKIFDKFKKLKSRVAVDFIFLGLKSFIYFKKKIINKKIKNVKIKWHFQAHHFKKNNNNTWKRNVKFGGGIYYFYLIHIVSYINFFFGRIVKIKKKTEFVNNLGEVYSVTLDLITSDKININLNFNSNSNKTTHSIKVNTSKKSYSLINNSKDYVKNFKIFITGKKPILDDTFLLRHNYKICDSRVGPVINLINNFLIKKKPTSSIVDAFNATLDLEKLIKER